MISTSHGNSKIVKNTFVAPVVPELGIIAPIYTVWDHCAWLHFNHVSVQVHVVYKSPESSQYTTGDKKPNSRAFRVLGNYHAIRKMGIVRLPIIST